MRTPSLAALLAAILIVAGCGADAADDTAAARAAATTTDTIRIKDFVFDPQPAAIRAGERIAVPNDDAAPHTLTDRPGSGDPRFDTGTLRGRQTGSFTAAQPGTYAIYCVIHPFMKGEIEVVAG
jgi:plastocyanin